MLNWVRGDFAFYLRTMKFFWELAEMLDAMGRFITRMFIVISLFLAVQVISKPNQLSLTEGEKQYLEQKKGTIDVLFGYQAPPEAFYNEHGNYIGILPDYAVEIEKRLNFKFRYKYFGTWDQIIEYSKTAQNFIIMGIAYTDSRSKYLFFTDSCIDLPYVVVCQSGFNITNMEDLVGKKVCTIEDYAVNDYMKIYFPDIGISTVNDGVEGLRCVSTGVYDAMITSQMSATYDIEEQAMTNLKIACESGYINRLGTAVSKKDPILFNIIQKAIINIPPETRQHMYRNWVSLQN